RAEPRLFLMRDLMSPESVKPERGIPAATAAQRFSAFLDVLLLVERLHSVGVIAGRIDSDALALRPDAAADASARRRFEPLFLSTDEFRIYDEPSGRRPWHAPNWLPPEVRAAVMRWEDLIAKGAPRIQITRARAAANVQTTESDVFKLGLL